MPVWQTIVKYRYILKRRAGRESKKIHKIEYSTNKKYYMLYNRIYIQIDSAAFTNVLRPSQQMPVQHKTTTVQRWKVQRKVPQTDTQMPQILYACNCLRPGSWHYHGGLALHGVLPSLAVAEWPGRCGFHCDGGSVLPVYCLPCQELLSCELITFPADVIK